MTSFERRIETALAAPAGSLRRAFAVVGGAALIAAAAQVAVPLPLTPVPWTLQPLAVLVVGGLLGPGLGAGSAATYLVIGALGLPVFAPGGALGLARFVGPTGGYLLAYPLAAYVMGRVGGDGRSLARALLGAAAGMALIHVGGVAKLALGHGDWSWAARIGSVPFWVGDAAKIVLAGLSVRRLAAPVRARL